MKIATAGTGYFGLSMAVLLSQHKQMVALDIDPGKVDMLNHKESPIHDADIEHYLQTKPLNLRATLNKQEAYERAEFPRLHPNDGRVMPQVQLQSGLSKTIAYFDQLLAKG